MMNFLIVERKKRPGGAEQFYKREADWKEAGESAKGTSERGYCRIILVARAIVRVTGIIRNVLYYYCSVLSVQSVIQKTPFQRKILHDRQNDGKLSVVAF